ncbi:MAG: hypothetical protein ACJA07_003112 [Rhodococcus sp. (in: high G+C Gram-positive bacteria)]|jgi:hypothetical protein
MGYLAISVDDETAVAVHRRDATVDPAVFETPCRLAFAEDGTVRLGDDAETGAASVSGFVSRVGQPAGVDGHRAEDLMAHTANCLLAMVTALHGGVAPAVAMTHPRSWGEDKIALLRDAFEHTGLHGVLLVPEDAATGEVESMISGNPTPVTGAAALAVGALAVLERSTQATPETADTDAIPIVEAPAALAFSEAPTFPVPALTPVGNEAGDARRRHRPLLVFIGVAVAAALSAVGVAAALGTFSDGADVDPPVITDAQVPAATDAPAPVPADTVEIPFPTAPEAPPSDVVRPPAPAPEPQPAAPAPEPEPAPAPAPEIKAPPTANPPTEIPSPTELAPVRPTIPRFTYPTAPRFTYPTIPRRNDPRGTDSGN